MFTGIIQEVGKVVEVTRQGGGMRIGVRAPATAAELHIGDSVSLSGACQTVVRKSRDVFRVVAVEETLSKTTLGRLAVGSAVNLELPLRLSERLGGHLVQGHVDCTGTIRSVEERESSRLLIIDYPAGFSRYVIPVGSIAVDGISLTVARKGKDTLTVSIIPHTLERTTLGGAIAGAAVNLEFDMVGKYIEQMAGASLEGPAGSEITKEKLRRWGYDV